MLTQKLSSWLFINLFKDERTRERQFIYDFSPETEFLFLGNNEINPLILFLLKLLNDLKQDIIWNSFWLKLQSCLYESLSEKFFDHSNFFLKGIQR